MTSTRLFFTVSMQVSDFPPQEAVMVEDPSVTAVTKPSSETVATDCFDEAHITVLSVAFDGKTLAVN